MKRAAQVLGVTILVVGAGVAASIIGMFYSLAKMEETR